MSPTSLPPSREETVEPAQESRVQAAVLDRMKRPIRDLRVSVTDRCNFRCTYCMPLEVFGERYEFLPKSEILTYEEITRLAGIFIGLGARKVRLTGGEPMVRDGIEKLVTLLAGIEGLEDLAMTTNGYLLAGRARSLKEAGLHRVTVSLDTLDDKVFGEMNGRGFGVARVLEGIDAAEAAGLGPIKIDAVVQRGVNDHTIVDLARRFKGTGHIVRFIEYMDVGNRNGWRLDQVVPSDEVVERINAEFPVEPVAPGYFGEVAQRYRYLDGSGEIGVISSVTQPFCGSCTRVRLSPQGEVYTCLFGTHGHDLRGPMRSGATDEELAGILTGVWADRTDRYSEIRASLTEPVGKKIEMYQIGG